MSALDIESIEVSNPWFEGRNQVYVIRSEPLTLIDSGVATSRAFEKLVAGLESLGHSLNDVGRVVLTHKHIDHIGNAWRIQQRTGAEILIHQSEAYAVEDVDPGGRRFYELVRQRLADWCVPENTFSGMEPSDEPHWEIESATVTPLVDGQLIELGTDHPLEVIHTPGHTFGSICLRYGKHLFSGDHVLTDVSPNIGGGDMRRRGMLSSFIQSLDRVSSMADQIDLVLPGHGQPLQTLAKRCEQLRQHHRQRLEEFVEILRREGPLEVFGAAGQLWDDLQDFHVVLGCAEAQSHLDYLVDHGRVVVEGNRYRLSGEE